MAARKRRMRQSLAMDIKGKSSVKNRLNLTKSNNSNINKRKNDARLRLLKTKRNKLNDAREVLAEIAKKHDAREKLIRLRQTKENANIVKPIGSNIVMKKDRNGKISLSTNKVISKKSMKMMANPIELVQKHLIESLNQNQMITSASRNVISGKRHVLKKSNLGLNAVSKSNILLNDTNLCQFLPTVSPVMMVNDYMHTIPDYSNLRHEEYIPPVIQRTIRNEIAQLPPLPEFSYKPSSIRDTRRDREDEEYNYRWAARNNSDRERVAAMDLEDTIRPPSVMKRIGNRPRPTYIDLDAPKEDDDIVMLTPPPPPIIRPVPSSSSRRNTSSGSNVRARLDVSPQRPSSKPLGIFAKNPDLASLTISTKNNIAPPKPVGYRIVVSNLHTTVTQEDIVELFSDIGELIKARLVRAGTAEVVYRKLEDAERAVENYHNRQLDGQPMKCHLVDNRASESYPLKSSTLRTISSGGLAKLPKREFSPDLEAVHKALFNKN